MSLASSLTGTAALASAALPAASAALARLLPAAAAFAASGKAQTSSTLPSLVRGYAQPAVQPAEAEPAPLRPRLARIALPGRSPSEAIEEVHGHIHSTESFRCDGVVLRRRPAARLRV